MKSARPATSRATARPAGAAQDNIAAAAPLHTTAGAAVLKDSQPDRDAFVVQKLRLAGTIILGKANLSEWANYMDACMSSGFSAMGGRPANPTAPRYLGSAAVCSFGVGQPDSAQPGSRLPARSSSRGATTGCGAAPQPGPGQPRDDVIPLGPDLDTTGPMGCSLADVAALLTVMAGVDKNDPKTSDVASLAGTDFTQFLSLDQARKLRVGVIILDQTVAAQLGPPIDKT